MTEKTKPSSSIAKERWDELIKDLEGGAYRVSNARGGKFTDIKPYFVFERLTEVFGLCGRGWKFAVVDEKIGKTHVVVRSELSYCIGGVWSEPIPSYGSSDISSSLPGDGYKAALTDSLTKAASYLGVGLRVFKGQFDNSEIPKDAREDLGKQPSKKSAFDYLTEIDEEMTKISSGYKGSEKKIRGKVIKKVVKIATGIESDNMKDYDPDVLVTTLEALRGKNAEEVIDKALAEVKESKKKG